MFSNDEQFARVFAAVAAHSQRNPPLTYEQQKELREKARKEGRLHQAAIKRRKKRKRGGPK